MPESGGGGKATTKKSKLGSKKGSHHVTQSKVVERLNAASGTQSPSRTGSKSPLPHNGRPCSKSPQPQSNPLTPPTQTLIPDAAPVAPPAPAPADPAPVAEQPVVDPMPRQQDQHPDVQKEAGPVVVEQKLNEKEVPDTIPPAPETVAPVASVEAAPPTPVPTADDLFPDMVWEDDVTDLLAASAAPLTVVPPVLPEIRTDPEAVAEAVARQADAPVSKNRSKKEKSPRRQKAKSPAPAVLAATVAAKEPSPPAQLQVPVSAPVTCPAVCEGKDKLVQPESAVESVTVEAAAPAKAVAPLEAAVESVAAEKEQKSETVAGSAAVAVTQAEVADAVQSPVSDSPAAPLSHPPQADSEKAVSNAPAGNQSKSKRKKNKSRSEDDPVKGASVEPPQPQNTIVSDIKQIREQISQTLVSNIFLSFSHFLEPLLACATRIPALFSPSAPHSTLCLVCKFRFRA